MVVIELLMLTDDVNIHAEIIQYIVLLLSDYLYQIYKMVKDIYLILLYDDEEDDIGLDDDDELYVFE